MTDKRPLELWRYHNSSQRAGYAAAPCLRRWCLRCWHARLGIRLIQWRGLDPRQRG